MDNTRKSLSKRIFLIFWIVLLWFLFIVVVISYFAAAAKEDDETLLIPVDGSVYYDSNGNKGENLWLSANGKSYFVGPEGVLLKDQIVEWSGIKYYLDENGIRKEGTNLVIDDTLYSAADDGALTLESGWLEVDGKRYYGDVNGKILKDQIVQESGTMYCLGPDGVPVTGDGAVADNRIYTADGGGELTPTTGWVQCGEDWYYGDPSGYVTRNKELTKDGSSCYVGADGKMVVSDFYIYEDAMYFADEKGARRKSEGWFHWKDRWYYSDAEGRFARNEYVTAGEEKCYVDDTGARIVGLPTIDQYLKCNDLYGFMVSHHNDYYLKTRYRGLIGNEHQPEVLIRPYGEFGKQQCGQNCTGFIASLVKYSGGDLDRVSAMGSYGKYANADNFLKLGTRGYVEYDTFSSVEEMLSSGKVHKGDILYLSPVWVAGADCHMGVYWGETSSDNAFWSQTLADGNSVTEIFMIDPIGKIYRFPISEYKETVYYNGSTP